ncbi:hypothetical protein P0L94_00465 [Microbacter sp. GSS18]|nr:hypothetical protein P0L94_00465 [Microbacter sp. GSS18]
MSTHTQRSAPATTGAPSAKRGFAPSRLLGVGFLILFGAGFTIMVLPPDIYSGTLEGYAAAFGDEGRLNLLMIASLFLFPLAGLLLAASVARVRQALGAEPAVHAAGRVAAFGAAFTAIGTSVAAAAATAGAHVVWQAEGSGFPSSPETGYGLAMFSSQLFNPALVGLSIVVVALGYGLRRAGRLPGWLAWAGYVLAPLMPIAWVLGMMPLFLIVIWVAVVTTMVDTEPQR